MSRGAIVIVGGGQAGAQVADALGRLGHGGPVTLIGDEPCLPYQRPPLSKRGLVDHCDAHWLAYRPAEFYARHDVRLETGRRVVQVDRVRHRVLLDDGRELPYEGLALATGTRVRRLAVPGAESCGVHYLRTIADAEAIRAALPAARRVVIVGGGFIGLEVAAVLAEQGREVVVLEAAPRLLPRVAAPELAEFLHEQHRQHGVRIATSASVSGIEREGTARIVCTADGQRWPADLVIAGIGIVPNVEVAAQCGLDCDDGILVDDAARTSDPDIVAAGDCTRHPNTLLGRQVRLETVHNAVEQGKVAAQTLAGRPARYAQVPWVWSDQFAFRLQVAGLVDGYDHHVVRGNPARGRFSVCYFRGERLLALQAINRPAEFAAARRLLNSRMAMTPAQAADPGFDLAACAQPRRRLDFVPPFERERAAPDRMTAAAIPAAAPVSQKEFT
jgi:3-phenylpropionate/trans-cinnamate dioxygenase ferredoxin reductase subunit